MFERLNDKFNVVPIVCYCLAIEMYEYKLIYIPTPPRNGVPIVALTAAPLFKPRVLVKVKLSIVNKNILIYNYEVDKNHTCGSFGKSLLLHYSCIGVINYGRFIQRVRIRFALLDIEEFHVSLIQLQYLFQKILGVFRIHIEEPLCIQWDHQIPLD